MSLIAEFTTTPSNRDEVADLIAAYAVQVRAEPGNVLFLPHQLSADRDHFIVYETYLTPAAFEAHLTAAKGAEFNAILEPLIVEEHAALTWLHGVPARV